MLPHYLRRHELPKGGRRTVLALSLFGKDVIFEKIVKVRPDLAGVQIAHDVIVLWGCFMGVVAVLLIEDDKGNRYLKMPFKQLQDVPWEGPILHRHISNKIEYRTIVLIG